MNDSHRPPCAPCSLTFDVVGLRVSVTCDSDRLSRVVEAIWPTRSISGSGRAVDLEYRVETDARSGGMWLLVPHESPRLLTRLGDLVFHLEKAVVVALQKNRPDLLFLHAAALERDGRAYLLVGESGSGKSTTTWGLLHHGFRYLSDELSPVDLRTLCVEGYPHALCLKRRPPEPYPLVEADILDLESTLHVPASKLPSGLAAAPCPLAAVLFVRYDADRREPAIEWVGPAEAGARLYVSTLNALAHAARGLDSVMRVVGGLPCFAVHAASLRSTCAAIVALDLGMDRPAEPGDTPLAARVRGLAEAKGTG